MIFQKVLNYSEKYYVCMKTEKKTQKTENISVTDIQPDRQSLWNMQGDLRASQETLAVVGFSVITAHGQEDKGTDALGGWRGTRSRACQSNTTATKQIDWHQECPA